MREEVKPGGRSLGWLLLLHNFIITIVAAGYTTAGCNLIASVFVINTNHITIVISSRPCIALRLNSM